MLTRFFASFYAEEAASENDSIPREPVLVEASLIKRVESKLTFYLAHGLSCFFPETGRKRAERYQVFITQFKGENPRLEWQLIVCLYNDIFANDKRLGNSQVLRHLLENALCEHLEISEEDRQKAEDKMLEGVSCYAVSAFNLIRQQKILARRQLIEGRLNERYPQLMKPAQSIPLRSMV